jgi:hypothetical protein
LQAADIHRKLSDKEIAYAQNTNSNKGAYVFGKKKERHKNDERCQKEIHCLEFLDCFFKGFTFLI